MPGFAKKDAYLRRRLCLCSIPFMPNFSDKDKHEFSGLSSLFFTNSGKSLTINVINQDKQRHNKKNLPIKAHQTKKNANFANSRKNKEMTHEEVKTMQKVPEPTLRRLPWYLAFIKLLQGRGESVVSSTQIAKEINVDASQVAKDLSYVNVAGKTRVGYEVDELTDELNDFLGFTSSHKAFLFGVGSLGAALLQDSGLKQYGLDIVAGFDVKPSLDGTSINGIPVYHLNRFLEKQKEINATIGVITVPVDKAQEVADQIIAGGIKGLWNFTPFRIRVPEHIVIQNTSMYAHLAVMFNRLNSINT